MHTAPTESISRLRKIAVIVRSTIAESGAQTDKFHRVLARALSSTGRWELVAAKSEVTLTATMTELSPNSRGAAVVATDVVLSDAWGKTITQFNVRGKSSIGTVFSGTNDEAFEHAANEIAAVLRRL